MYFNSFTLAYDINVLVHVYSRAYHYDKLNTTVIIITLWKLTSEFSFQIFSTKAVLQCTCVNEGVSVRCGVLALHWRNKEVYTGKYTVVLFHGPVKFFIAIFLYIFSNSISFQSCCYAVKCALILNTNSCDFALCT